MKMRFLIPLVLAFTLCACNDSDEKSAALVKSAVIKIYNHDTEAALSELQEAIRLNPENAEAYFYRANIRYGATQYDSALADYNRSIAINEGFADAWSNRGDLYQATGNMDRACSDWHIAVSLGKQNMQDKLRFCGPPTH